jgi:glycosyltransferase involved in cell wall biosynthesis
MIQTLPTLPTPVPHQQVPANRALRVLHLDSGREWRGRQRQLELLAAGLRRSGHEPLVVVTPRSALHRHLQADGIAVATIAMRNRLDLMAVRRLRRLISTWRPDLLHAHDPRSHSLALTALVGRRNSIPLVVTRRSHVPPRGTIGYRSRVARFIAVSDAVREALVRAGIKPARVSRVYPTVSRPSEVEPRDWRAECGWPADSVVAGVTGEFAAPGGAAVLDAIARLIPPDARARLRVVTLGGRAGGHDAIGEVACYRAGFVHDVHRAIAGLDLLLHSGSADGLGTAVIDAMSFGVPCIAFDGGSVAEIIDDGRTGRIVPRGDTPAFALAVAGLVSDGTRRTQLGEAGRVAAGRFDRSHFVDGVLAVYRDVVERSKV